MKVSSKAMSMASPVWRAMLDPKGRFRESQPGNDEIDFPDDDAEALLILLLAAHLRFQDVPQELYYEQLLKICVACDKYDCVSLVRPWISRWQARQIHHAGQDYYEDWIFIAWTVGDQETFERIGRRFVKTCRTGSNDPGRCTTPWGSFTPRYTPPGIEGGLRKIPLITLLKYSAKKSIRGYTRSSSPDPHQVDSTMSLAGRPSISALQT